MRLHRSQERDCTKASQDCSNAAEPLLIYPDGIKHSRPHLLLEKPLFRIGHLRMSREQLPTTARHTGEPTPSSEPSFYSAHYQAQLCACYQHQHVTPEDKPIFGWLKACAVSLKEVGDDSD